MRDELDRVLDATLRLGELVPVAPTADRRPAVRRDVHRLAHARRRGPDAVADRWCRDRLDELAAAEARWEQVTVGDGLIHGDVRSDNVLLTDDGRVVFVDWTSTCTGAGWFEVLAMLPVGRARSGGGPPESVLARVGLGDLDPDRVMPAGRRARPATSSSAAACPTRPACRRSRPFQRAQGEVTHRVAAPAVGSRPDASERPVPADAEQPVAVLVGA